MMKPSEITIIGEYNRIALLQRNNGLTVDRVAICNVIAAKFGHRQQDVLDVMEGKQ
jgi:hypothetical protein